MKKVFLLSGVLLFVLGSALVIGSYLVFNKYSTSGSHHFSTRETWSFPSPPLELSEGDMVAVELSFSGSGSGTLSIANTAGQKVGLSNLGNWIDYYYVQSDNLYYFYTEISSISLSSGMDLTLNVEVTRKAPNLLFQLIGGIILLAGAVTIPIAFLYKNRYPKQPTT